MKTLLLLLALALPLHARIGETLEELEKGLGKPSAVNQPLPNIRTVRWNLTEIHKALEVNLVNGKATSESYFPVTEAEALDILKNQDLGEFKQTALRQRQEGWINFESAHGFVASYSPQAMKLIVAVKRVSVSGVNNSKR